MNVEMATGAETDQVTGIVVLGLTVPVVDLKQVNAAFGITEAVERAAARRKALDSTAVAAPLLAFFEGGGDFGPVFWVAGVHGQAGKVLGLF
jgi:hypothetical protein